MSAAASANMPSTLSRHLPVGAEVVPEAGVHFRVWAPDCGKVELVLEPESHSADHQRICDLQNIVAKRAYRTPRTGERNPG
jgi:1,4-alpha-glucan branching enzyme